MQTLINFIKGFIANPFGIVISSFLLFLCCLLLVAIPFITLYALINALDYIGYQIGAGIGALFIVVLIIGILWYLENELTERIAKDRNEGIFPPQFALRAWKIWRALFKWMLAFVAAYSVLFFIQMAMIIIENDDPSKITEIALDVFKTDVYGLHAWISGLCIVLSIFIALVCALYIKWVITDEEWRNKKTMKRIVRYKLLALVCGTTGAAFAIFTPYIVALINNSKEEVIPVVENTIGALIIITGVVVLLLITPHNISMAFKVLKVNSEPEGASTSSGVPSVAMSLFFWGMAVPAFVVSWAQEEQVYKKQATKVTPGSFKEISNNNNEESYLDFNLQEGSPPKFFRTAFANDETGNDLNSLLHEESPLSTARDFFFSSDYGAKKYVISIAKFDSSKKAIRFRNECLAEGHNIADSQVIQLISNVDYRVIFPPFDKQIAKGDASHKMDLIETRITADSDCAGIDPTLLEFE